jgi:hypothetical protein
MQPIDTVESRAAVMEDTTASVIATQFLFEESKVYGATHRHRGVQGCRHVGHHSLCNSNKVLVCRKQSL